MSDADQSPGLRLGQRDAFDVPADIAYFNTASLSPQLRAVRVAGEEALDRRSRPWTITSEEWFADVERLRGIFGELIGSDAEGVALVPATSYGFAVAARNIRLRPGDRVLVLADEYPSGIYTWRAATKTAGAEIITARRTDTTTWTDAILEALDERVAVVSVPNVHWTDGSIIDLATVSERTHQIGAQLVIDGSQSIGALPIDVDTVRPDFMVTVGYKWLLGPFGVGYLYVAPEHRDGQPIEHNWIVRQGATDFARLVDYRDEYQPGSRRFDVGERTKFELLPMAIAALEQVVAWQVPRIADALGKLTTTLSERLEALGLDPPAPDQRGPHLLGVSLPKTITKGLLPGLAAANCFAAVRGRSLRLSPHLHVMDDDVNRLIGALASLELD